MTIRVSILPKEIKAATLFAAKNSDPRHCLHDILLDFGPTGNFLVATNGAMMAVIRVEDQSPLDRGRYMLPIELCSIVGKWTNCHAELPVTVEFYLDRLKLSRRDGCLISANQLPQGEFPEWRKIIPKSLSNNDASYKAEYVKILQCAQAVLVGYFDEFASIQKNGLDAGFFKISENSFAIVMPFRTYERISLPDWVVQLSA